LYSSHFLGNDFPNDIQNSSLSCLDLSLLNIL
jgi:hypothetical protein